MEENFVWMTTRRIKPGTLADFERLWRPERHPDGMLHAYAYWSDDEHEIIGWCRRGSPGRHVMHGGHRGRKHAGVLRWLRTS